MLLAAGIILCLAFAIVPFVLIMYFPDRKKRVKAAGGADAAVTETQNTQEADLQQNENETPADGAD